MAGKIGAILMKSHHLEKELATLHPTHTRPSGNTALVALSLELPGKRLGRHQVRGKGFTSALTGAAGWSASVGPSR